MTRGASNATPTAYWTKKDPSERRILTSVSGGRFRTDGLRPNCIGSLNRFNAPVCEAGSHHLDAGVHFRSCLAPRFPTLSLKKPPGLLREAGANDKSPKTSDGARRACSAACSLSATR